MVDEGRILEPACSSMLPDLHRERARIDEAATALLAARDRLDALIALTTESGVTDEEACAAVAGRSDRITRVSAARGRYRRRRRWSDR